MNYKFQSSVEINVPIKTVWSFLLDPVNWLIFGDSIESYSYEGEIKTGSVIMCKAKDKEIYIPLFMTNVNPYKETASQIKAFLISMKCTDKYEQISPEKTRIISVGTVKSIILPFAKSSLIKCMNEQTDIGLKALLALSVQSDRYESNL